MHVCSIIDISPPLYNFFEMIYAAIYVFLYDQLEMARTLLDTMFAI